MASAWISNLQAQENAPNTHVPMSNNMGRGRGRGISNSSITQSPSPGLIGDAASAFDGPADEVKPGEMSYIAKLLRNTLVADSKNEVEIVRANPTSPLYSVKSFEELHLKPELLHGIRSMGFNRPSKIQETALPIIVADPFQNLIAQSQSGTGKTASFVLGMLSRVDVSQPYTQAICLSPTYELAKQTGEVVSQMGSHMPGLKIRYAIRNERKVRKGEKVGEHIVIGTPGTLLDWVLRFDVFYNEKIKIFVLDEADVMIATQGHQDQSIRIQKKFDVDKCQMLLFSATFDEEVIKFAKKIVDSPIVIRLKPEEQALDSIRQCYIECNSPELKMEALWSIYAGISVGQAIIFCHTRKLSEYIAKKMLDEDYSVELLNGDLDVDQRIAILNRFRAGKVKVLITTNVCARGIDIDQVTLVVNFDLPVLRNGKPDYETYLHRIGRTGRFGNKGVAVNIIENRELPILHEIESYFNRPIVPLDPTNLSM